jgi:preprotein translocase subunit SecA
MTLLDILGMIFGSKQDRDIKKILPVLAQVNGFRDAMSSLSG